MTTALEGGEGSASRPGRSLPPGKSRYPLYRRLGGPQGRSGQVRKISPHRDSIPGPSKSMKLIAHLRLVARYKYSFIPPTYFVVCERIALSTPFIYALVSRTCLTNNFNLHYHIIHFWLIILSTSGEMHMVNLYYNKPTRCSCHTTT